MTQCLDGWNAELTKIVHVTPEAKPSSECNLTSVAYLWFVRRGHTIDGLQSPHPMLRSSSAIYSLFRDAVYHLVHSCLRTKFGNPTSSHQTSKSLSTYRRYLKHTTSGLKQYFQ